MEQPTKLFNRNFFIQWQGQTISKLGAQVFGITMLLWIQQTTGSATIMGLLYMLAAIPGIALGPIGGTFADRYSRKKIIILSDSIRGVAILLLTIFIFRNTEATDAIIIGLFIVAILNGILSTFFGPAISAAIPDLVPKESVNAANSMGQASTQITLFIGQGLGGWLFQTIGAPILFLFNAFTFFYAAISQTFVKIPQEIPEKFGDWRQQFRDFYQDLVNGFKYIINRPGLRDTVIISAILGFFVAPLGILLPFFVEDYLKVEIAWTGYILAAFGIGSFFGYIFAGAIRFQPKTRGRFLLVLIFAQAIGFFIFGFVRNSYIALLMGFLYGFVQGVVLVNITTILQITTSGEMRGRIFGILATISSSLTPIAMGLTGVVVDLINQNIPAIFIGSGIIMILITAVVSLDRHFRNFLASEGTGKIVQQEV
jgi:MFS family permease